VVVVVPVEYARRLVVLVKTASAGAGSATFTGEIGNGNVSW